jgi:hypothetical protein
MQAAHGQQDNGLLVSGRSRAVKRGEDHGRQSGVIASDIPAGTREWVVQAEELN